MKIEELAVGTKLYTWVARRVLAVLSRRAEGWCVYVGAVPGKNYDEEWQDVAAHGDKQPEPVARAIVKYLFRKDLDPDGLPYAQ